MKEIGKIFHLVSKTGCLSAAFCRYVLNRYHSGQFDINLWVNLLQYSFLFFLFKSGCESALTVIPPFEKHFGCCFDGSCLLWSLNYVLSLGFHGVVGLIVTSVHVHHCQQ
jgi:hypothetical protein